MEEKIELGIYIHIPFCKQKCYYCDFISYPNQEEKQNQYIEKLRKEIEEKKEILQNHKITTIYIGGGTPSYIAIEQMEKILKTLKNCLNETIQKEKKELEITIEINPGTVNKEKLKRYREIGINRISIGLQTTKDVLLKKIGRIHTMKQFKQTYEWTKEVGFNNINIDLMIGLPEQSITDMKESLEEITKLEPTHISVYSLILEEGTKLEKKITEGELKLPEEEIERNMYWYVKNKLELAGYEHYEISNFAKKGKESKHNLNCWEQKEYIGFGVAAHSYRKGIRYSNTENLQKYLEAKNWEEIKTVHEVQKEEDKQKEYMLLGLRKIEGITISKFKQKFGSNPIYLFRKQLEKLVEEELIKIDLDKIKLTNKGLDFANLVWEEFV